MHNKDIAKVLYGAAIVEILNHLSLALNNLLPLHFFGILISRPINTLILFCWVIIFIVSGHYAWFKK